MKKHKLLLSPGNAGHLKNKLYIGLNKHKLLWRKSKIKKSIKCSGIQAVQVEMTDFNSERSIIQGRAKRAQGFTLHTVSSCSKPHNVIENTTS